MTDEVRVCHGKRCRAYRGKDVCIGAVLVANVHDVIGYHRGGYDHRLDHEDDLQGALLALSTAEEYGAVDNHHQEAKAHDVCRGDQTAGGA